MKAFNKIIMIVMATLVLLLLAANVFVWVEKDENTGRMYRVEANRVAQEIQEKGLQGVNLSNYQTITAIVPMSEENREFLEGGEEDYLFRKIGERYYRISYVTSMQKVSGKAILLINIFLVLMSILIMGVLVFVRQKILKPFVALREIPYELSKGNLTIPVKENKSRFFGRFIWGVNLLRENLEEQKQRELKLQKEKRLLILSISHDIKTPLSAIKLYAKALSKGLYKEKEKQDEIAEHIYHKADEIEHYVSQIVEASREDFLKLEVNMGEFYLSELVERIRRYYTDIWKLFNIQFEEERLTDYILKGDLDRAIEVLQNVMENAIKYGDGNRIRMEYAEEEDCCLLTVRNTGCTLSENEILHIFESFWRGSNVKNNEGSGLGLYICRQLMRKMGGEIYGKIQGSEMCVTAVFRKA